MKKKTTKQHNNEVFCYPDTLLNKFIPQAWQIHIMQTFIQSYKKKNIFLYWRKPQNIQVNGSF